MNIKSFKDLKELFKIDTNELKNSLKDVVLNNIDEFKTFGSSLNQIIVRENDLRQDALTRDSSVYNTIKAILDYKDDTPEETVTVPHGKSKLTFKGEKVERKIIESNKTRLKVSDLQISNYLVSTLLNKFDTKFYGKLLRTEDGFKDSIINDKA